MYAARDAEAEAEAEAGAEAEAEAGGGDKREHEDEDTYEDGGDPVHYQGLAAAAAAGATRGLAEAMEMSLVGGHCLVTAIATAADGSFDVEAHVIGSRRPLERVLDSRGALRIGRLLSAARA